MSALGARRAAAITGGAFEHAYAKFTKTSWPTLAEINATGYVTFDCQDAATRGERSFVDGFMDRRAAVPFADAFNTSCDMVCVATPDCGAWHACSRVPMVKERAIIENQVPLLFDNAIVVHFALQVGMDTDEVPLDSVVVVRCFDPAWGRSAAKPGGLLHHVLQVSRLVATTRGRRSP
jgi:hypothetical protein